ncbi:hypothetical protein I79_025671 [Cricetulus griseus]|uniref:Uncharacterized protein n=1 Tax=Cricetulus griseus TaxID=10029 RepID=G3INX5_CRIGR|nr:hypothetical protein I79_025671 [Cricetulus griseus]
MLGDDVIGPNRRPPEPVPSPSLRTSPCTTKRSSGEKEGRRTHARAKRTWERDHLSVQHPSLLVHAGC